MNPKGHTHKGDHITHHHWQHHRPSITELTARCFAWYHTVFCFTAFVIPIWLLSYVIASEYQVTYWISEDLKKVMYLWVLYLGTHIYHLHHGAPSKPLIVFNFLCSCLVLLFVGMYVSAAALSLAEDLEPTVSCASSGRGFGVEMEWQFAREFYVTCMVATANESAWLSFDQAVAKYRMPHCALYATLSGIESDQTYGGVYPEWRYLADTESEFNCAGWCVAAKQPLWTFEATKDGCATAVAERMRNTVHRAAMQVVIYSLIALASSPLLWRAAIPVMREFGAENKASDFKAIATAVVTLDF